MMRDATSPRNKQKLYDNQVYTWLYSYFKTLHNFNNGSDETIIHIFIIKALYTCSIKMETVTNHNIIIVSEITVTCTFCIAILHVNKLTNLLILIITMTSSMRTTKK